MGMDRMFRMLGFWLLMMSLMFLAGGMTNLAILFFVQTIAFVAISYFRLTERAYMYIFGGYMFVAFVGMVFWAFFIGVPSGE